MIKNKRKFITSDIWSDEWFMELSMELKMFWIFLITSSDITGLWKPSFKEASFYIGDEIKRETVEDVFSEQIMIINRKKWFIKNYWKYQYSNQLKFSNPVHKRVVKELILEGIAEDNLKSLGYTFCHSENSKIYQITNLEEYFTKGLQSDDLQLPPGRPPLNPSEDKDKDKDEYKEKIESKEKEMFKEKDEKELIELKSIDVKKDYPVLVGLTQLTEEQMKALLEGSSVAQIREALEGINRTRKHITNNSVYESVKEYMNENQQLPF